MSRCYSCHEKNSEHKCSRCGAKVCENCSILIDYKHICTGCFADNQDKEWLKSAQSTM